MQPNGGADLGAGLGLAWQDWQDWGQLICFEAMATLTTGTNTRGWQKKARQVDAQRSRAGAGGVEMRALTGQREAVAVARRRTRRVVTIGALEEAEDEEEGKKMGGKKGKWKTNKTLAEVRR